MSIFTCTCIYQALSDFKDKCKPLPSQWFCVIVGTHWEWVGVEATRHWLDTCLGGILSENHVLLPETQLINDRNRNQSSTITHETALWHRHTPKPQKTPQHVPCLMSRQSSQTPWLPKRNSMDIILDRKGIMPQIARRQPNWRIICSKLTI